MLLVLNHYLISLCRFIIYDANGWLSILYLRIISCSFLSNSSAFDSLSASSCSTFSSNFFIISSNYQKKSTLFSCDVHFFGCLVTVLPRIRKPIGQTLVIIEEDACCLPDDIHLIIIKDSSVPICMIFNIILEN